MPSDGLIVIVPVKVGTEEALRLTLNRIGHDIRGRRMEAGLEEPRIDFPSSRTLHFARLALLEHPKAGPGRKRLLLVTDYEGSWEAHVAELISLTTDPDAIWGCCEGYTDSDHFDEFIRAHTVSPQAYYIALPGFTLDRIRELIQSRLQQDTWLPNLPGRSFVGKLLNMGADLAKFPLAGLDILGLVWQHGPFNTLMAARQVNATLDRIWYIRLFNLLTLNSHPAPTHRYSQAPVDSANYTPDPGDEVTPPSAWDEAPPEDLVSQNQLTLVTVVRPEQARRLHAVLGVIDLYGRRLAEPGSLIGISTIHTVRWALLDNDRRLLLASNYDGPWENYIDEFAELILSGLDAIWSSSLGYPIAGAQDVEALKHFLRSHQVPANAFYSAIPQATLLNIVDALALEPQALPESLPAAQPAWQGAAA
jgi:hypothetical protein